jgi:hypothetical protein
MKLHSDRYVWRLCSTWFREETCGVEIKDTQTEKTKFLNISPGAVVGNVERQMNSLTDEQFKDWLKK